MDLRDLYLTPTPTLTALLPSPSAPCSPSYFSLQRVSGDSGQPLLFGASVSHL